MRFSILSIAIALSSLLVNAAPTTQFEPVLVNRQQVDGYYKPLARRSPSVYNQRIKRQDGALLLGVDGQLSISSLVVPSATSTVEEEATSTTSFKKNPKATSKIFNPKLTMLGESPSSSVGPTSTSIASSTALLSPSSVAQSSSSSSSSSAAPPKATSNPSASHLVSGSYYPDWSSDVLPPASIDFSKFNLIYFAFALPDENFNLYFTQSNSVTLLQDVVRRAHAANSQVVVSVGGWTGSKWFSPAVATSSSRNIFAANIVKMVNDYGLDGIDLDWEYPGGPGNAGNIYTGDDSANLLLLLQQLRQSMGANKLITMATAHNAFKGPNGQPLADVSAHAKILDHILLMNYDVWGASANPGPNAPLDNACGNSLQPGASAKAGIDQWSAAGMPLNKIVLGLPAYGYVSTSSANKLVTRKRGAVVEEEKVEHRPIRRSEWMAAGIRERKKRDLVPYGALTVTDPESGAVITICPDNHGGKGCDGSAGASTKTSSGAITLPSGSIRMPSIKASASGDLSAYKGMQVGFNTLVSLGVLSRSSSGQYTAINGYQRLWDSCSSTPFLKNSVRSTIVTYDDPDSIRLKAQYAKSRGIGGVAFWDMATDDRWALMDAARQGFGFA